MSLLLLRSRQSGAVPIFTHRKEHTDEASHYPIAGGRFDCHAICHNGYRKGGGKGPDQSRFIGTWSSTDLDGSHQTMSIKLELPILVRYYDDMATACFTPWVEAARSSAWRAIIDGKRDVGSEVRCLNDPGHPEYGTTWYMGSTTGDTTYDPSTDTLSSMGVTWIAASEGTPAK